MEREIAIRDIFKTTGVFLSTHFWGKKNSFSGVRRIFLGDCLKEIRKENRKFPYEKSNVSSIVSFGIFTHQEQKTEEFERSSEYSWTLEDIR